MEPTNPALLQPTAGGLIPTATGPTSGLYQTNPWMVTGTPNASSFGTTGMVLNSLGMPVPAPTQGQDPAALAANIQTALAKLDTVNPDLANQMRSQYMGVPEKDAGGLMGVLGDIGHAFTSGFGELLDLLGRTSHIVPAMLVHDKDPWYTDMAQAISGQDKSTWNDVFKEQGHTGIGWSILGFAGDVATDPLTYAFGAGSLMSTAERAAYGAKAALVATIKGRAVEIGMQDASKVADFSEKLWSAMKGEGDNLKMLFAGKSPEEGMAILAGRTGVEVTDASRTLLADAWSASAQFYAKVYGRTVKTFLKSGESLKLPSTAELAGSDIQSLLESYVKLGNYIPGERYQAAVVAQAKAAAGVLGGFRLTPFIPWTSFRYFTPTLPFTMGTFVTRPFMSVARFAAGKSVIARAETLVSNLGPKAIESLAILNEGGLKALKDAADPVSRQVYELLGESGFKSAFYRGSELAGGLTAAFTPGAKQFRAGLGFYLVESNIKAGRSAVRNFVSNDLYNTVNVKTSAAKQEAGGGEQKLFALWEQVYHTSNRERFNTATEADHWSAAQFLDFFGGLQGQAPISATDVQTGRFDQWFWSNHDVVAKLADAVPGEEQAVRATLDAQLSDMKGLLAKFPEGSKERDLFNQESAVLSRGNDIIGFHGIHSRDIGYADLGTQRIIRPEDRALAEAHTISGVKGQHWYAVPSGKEGFTSADVVGTEHGIAGIPVFDKPVEGSVEVVLNMRDPFLVGTSGKASEAGQAVTNVLSDEPRIAAAHAEAEAGLRNMVAEMATNGNDILPGSVLSPENWDRSVAEDTSALLAKNGGLGKDGAFIRNADGSTQIVLLGTDQVPAQDMIWAFSPDAAAIRKSHGFFTRTLCKQFREFLGGVYGDARRTVRSTPEMEARMVRATADKTLAEADKAMRAEAARIMVEDKQPAALIAKLFAKDDNGQYLLKVLEINPLRAHEHYVDRVGQAVWGSLMGLTSERMNALGRLVPSQFGRVVHIEQARSVVDVSAYSMVKKAGKKVEAAVQKFITKEKVYLDAQITDNGVASERFAELLRRWELGENVDLTDIPALNPHTQRLLRASDNLTAAAEKERARLAGISETWTTRSADTAQVEKVLEDANVTQPDAPWASRMNNSHADHTGLMPRSEVEKYVDPNMVREPRVTSIKGATPEPMYGLKSRAEFDALKEDIRKNGFQEPIIIDYNPMTGKGSVAEGYHRIAAAKELGINDVPVVFYRVAKDGPVAIPIEHSVVRFPEGAISELGAVNYPYRIPSVWSPQELAGKPFISRETLNGLLNNGELGIHADGSILTREGRARLAGKGAARRVYSRQEVDQALTRAADQAAELEKVIANPYTAGKSETAGIVSHMTAAEEAAAQTNFAARLAAKTGEKPTLVTHAVTLEPYDVALARQEALAGSKVARRTSIEVSAEQVTKARQSLGVAVKREARAESVAAAKEAARKQRLGRTMEEAQGALNDMIDVYQNAQAKLRPAIVSGKELGGHQYMREVSIPGLQGTWWHPYIAQELESQLYGKPITSFRNAWREFVLNPWKKWATYRNPGFHVRNFFGIWFNNFLGGVMTSHYHFASRVMSARDGGKWGTKLLKPDDFRELGLNNIPGLAELEGKMTYGDMANLLTDTGITRGSAAAVELVQGGFTEKQRIASKAAVPARWADQHLRRLSSTIEDFGRVAAWARGMQMTPGDLYGARSFVMMRHGDYGDLTDTENFIRDIVPFYKWMRTNVPYQIRMLATNPGYMTGVMKLQKSIFDVAGLDAAAYQRAMPDWMKGSVSIPLPGARGADTPVNMIGFDLPFMDLYKGAREYASSFLPGILPLLESMVTKQVTFSGKALTGKMVPLGGIFQLPGIKQAVAALPFAQMGPDGQVYLPDMMENVLTGIPIYGRFRNWLTGDPARVEKRWGALTSFMLGMPIRQVDLTQEEQLFYFDVLVPTLQSYQSMGVVFPTKDQLIAAGRSFEQPTPDLNAMYPSGVVGQAA